MAHELTRKDTMFSVRETPWHGLGTVVQDAPTTAAAIALAGLDWSVDLVPLYTWDEDAPEDESVNQIDTSIARAVKRSTDGEVLGVVGGRFTALQNADAFAWFDPIVDAGEATLETAGSLRGGRRVWILAKMGHNGDSHADVVPGDTVKNHLLLAHGHDGSMAIKVSRVRTRVVCANTLRGALGEGNALTVRHTRAASATLADVRDLVRAEHEAFARDVDAYRQLAKTPVTSATIREYVQKVWPERFIAKRGKKAAPALVAPAYAPPAGVGVLDDLLGGGFTPTPPAARVEVGADDIEAAGDEILSRIGELVEVGMGADLPGVRGTAWGLYNAASEYLQYHQGRGPAGATERRMDSLAFGASATKNAIALNAALDFAQRHGVRA